MQVMRAGLCGQVRTGVQAGTSAHLLKHTFGAYSQVNTWWLPCNSTLDLDAGQCESHCDSRRGSDRHGHAARYEAHHGHHLHAKRREHNAEGSGHVEQDVQHGSGSVSSHDAQICTEMSNGLASTDRTCYSRDAACCSFNWTRREMLQHASRNDTRRNVNRAGREDVPKQHICARAVVFCARQSTTAIRMAVSKVTPALGSTSVAHEQRAVRMLSSSLVHRPTLTCVLTCRATCLSSRMCEAERSASM
jgi:hypothetical protein